MPRKRPAAGTRDPAAGARLTWAPGSALELALTAAGWAPRRSQAWP